MLRPAVTLLAAVLVGPRVAGAEALTLDAALARAMQSNVELAAARADLVAARGRLEQASVLAANPVVTSSGTNHRIASETNIDAAVSLGQEIQVGGQRGLRMAAARFDVEHAEALRADHERLVAGEVRRAFAGLVAAERRQVVAAEVAAQSRRLAGIAATRLAQGDVGRLDVDLARLDQTKAEADAAAAVTDVERATARLAVALGAGPDETFALAAPEATPHATPAEADVIDRALATRPDLRAARAERARLDGEADLTRRVGLIPNPTLRGFYSHENGDETLVGGEISVPLPIFDRQVGAELDLRGQAASAATAVVRLEHQIPRDVRVALAHHRTAEATWMRRRRDADDVVPAARATLERALSAGLLGLSDVLVQQDRLRDARRAEVDAWLDLREAEADVLEAVGENPW